MMKALTLAAAAIAFAVTGAAAEPICPDPNARCKARDNPKFYRDEAAISSRQMPTELIAEWCHVGDGAYVAAKKFCAKSRDVIFYIHTVGFHIRFNDVKPMYLCVPLQLEASGGVWHVTAACGLNDNSGPVSEKNFTFKLTDGRMILSFGLTQGEKP